MNLSFSQNITYLAKKLENVPSSTHPQDPFIFNNEHEPSQSTARHLQDQSDSQSLPSTSLTTRNQMDESAFSHVILNLNIETEPTRESTKIISN